MSTKRTNRKSRKEAGKHKKTRRKAHKLYALGLGSLFIVAYLTSRFLSSDYISAYRLKQVRNVELPSWIDSQIIEVDGHSRRGEPLDGINDIVIHYVGNPGTTAQQNRNYYTNEDSNVSSHFVIGLDGEIIQCIPLDEMSSASNWRNNDTISIEVCHPDDTGEFTQATYDSLVKLTAWLEGVCHLDESHVIRHYDITEKECPRYFVQHEDKWEEFKQDVKDYRRSQ
jgi:N-acetylmuramoyl-L-alanine amidase CwlA